MAKEVFLTLALVMFPSLFIMAGDDMFGELWRITGLSESLKGKNNDVERFQYHGNVRSVNVYGVKKTEDGKIVKGDLLCTRIFDKQKRIIEYRKGDYKFTFRYDSLGRCVEKKEFKYEKMKYHRIRCYNAQGNLLTDRNFKEGNLYEERRNIYDEANRLVCSTEIYDGELSKVLHITYDKKGNMVDSSEYVKERDSMVLDAYTRKEYDGEGKLLSMEKKHTYRTTREVYSYDEAGRLEKMSRKLIDDYKPHCLTFHYGKDGRLCSMDSIRCSTQGICDRTIMTAYYDSLGRRVSKHFLLYESADSMVYDAKGRVVKMIEDYNPKTGHVGHLTNILYDQEGNVVERHTQYGEEWEKNISKYKNGYETEQISYVGKEKKYRKRTSMKDVTVGVEGSDATWTTTMPIYEYVDKPWAENRIVKKYDKRGNMTYMASYEEGERITHSVATYQGRNRPLTCVSYYKGEVTSSSVYKTDSHGNVLEEYIHGVNGLDTGIIREFEYYDE
ncbi:MAG: hypothetical protein J6Y22_07220 [Paludibacteraceae bacterium]|nr:hypothetical protein [Paludibacteraceae bacterium]